MGPLFLHHVPPWIWTEWNKTKGHCSNYLCVKITAGFKTKPGIVLTWPGFSEEPSPLAGLSHHLITQIIRTIAGPLWVIRGEKKHTCRRQGKEVPDGLPRIKYPRPHHLEKQGVRPLCQPQSQAFVGSKDLYRRPELFQPPKQQPGLKRNRCLWYLLTRAGKLSLSLKCRRRWGERWGGGDIGLSSLSELQGSPIMSSSGWKLPLVSYQVRERGVKVSTAEFTVKCQDFARRKQSDVSRCTRHVSVTWKKSFHFKWENRDPRFENILPCTALPGDTWKSWSKNVSTYFHIFAGVAPSVIHSLWYYSPAA